MVYNIPGSARISHLFEKLEKILPMTKNWHISLWITLEFSGALENGLDMAYDSRGYRWTISRVEMLG
ncbi:MAG: hypothetical protein KDH88_10645, partial [Chromatiales bacterium]|nr:hypothetical protein [Chromatiales bacterium]